ncbi:MAG: hybrid sensor histidine kinase/response regulator [Verrucomicrobia bacterium]|nr:hybrid sensor histidine kinase/response regulator [Verrucomicrobiota bacterium]
MNTFHRQNRDDSASAHRSNLGERSGKTAGGSSESRTKELQSQEGFGDSDLSFVGKVNILIVDDDPAKLLAHEAILEDLGQNLVKARSGREALELLLKKEFAAVLLDVKLPDVDGFEVASLIRQRPSLERTPIIFITGYSTTDLDRLKGYDVGAADYLFLPVVPAVLKAKVQVFVEVARQKQIVQRQAERLALHNQQQQEQIRTIQELNWKLKSAYEELESFSYSVSHDLRSPLRAMQGYSQILLEEFKGRLGPEGEDFLKRINKAAFRMDALIRDILSYSQVTKTEVRTEKVDLESVAEDLVRESRALKEAEARVVIQKPLHPVIGHLAYLTQCLSNLLDNASKFVPENTTPEITVRTERIHDRVRIWVEDNGIGIDPSFHDRIFKMFERGDSGRRYDGTGIGLTIVKKAVEKMGGSVGVESSPAAGSRFWIELPSPDS